VQHAKNIEDLKNTHNAELERRDRELTDKYENNIKALKENYEAEHTRKIADLNDYHSNMLHHKDKDHALTREQYIKEAIELKLN